MCISFIYMDVSCVIVTYHRVQPLNALLSSIKCQTVKPKEIILVDNTEKGNDDICNLIKDKYGTKDIHYFRNPTGNNISGAKNYGIKKAKGDIVLFFDDDLVLDKNYVEQILKVYKHHPEAVGVQGYIKNTGKPLYYRFTEKMIVTSWGFNTYPLDIKKTIPCEWMSGGNSSYKKEIFNSFKFDEKLKKYSFKEDVALSYAVFKKHKGGLFITPKALATHNHAAEGRLADKELIYTKTKNTFYFFFKYMKQTRKAQFYFICWEIGFTLFMILRSLKQMNLKKIKYLFGSYLYAIKNIDKIKKGDLDF